MNYYFDSPTLGAGKLVRDRVGEEIAGRDGAEPVFKLPTSERVAALLRKLREEAAEAEAAIAQGEDAVGEELADVLDVVAAVAEQLFINIEAYRLAKQKRRGLFGLFLFLRAADLDRWHAGGGK